MFTINLGDGREAPSKARKKGAKRLEFLVLYNLCKYIVNLILHFSLLMFTAIKHQLTLYLHD